MGIRRLADIKLQEQDFCGPEEICVEVRRGMLFNMRLAAVPIPGEATLSDSHKCSKCFLRQVREGSECHAPPNWYRNLMDQ